MESVNSPFLDTAAAEPDSLLNCLIAVAAFHDRAVSADALTAGLPLTNGRLTPALFERAAQRAGYAARLVERSLDRLNPIVLPAILLLENNDACVLLRKLSKHTFEFYDPLTDTRSTITSQDIKDAYTGQAILIKPEVQLGARGPETSASVSGHWFWSVIRQLWPSYLQVIIAAGLINVLALASPIFIMTVYDKVLPNKAISTLWVLAAGMGLAVLFDLVLRSLRGWLIDAAGRRADVLLAGRIFEHVLGIKLNQRPNTTGSFANQLREFESVRDFFTSGTLATLTDVGFFGLFLFVIYKIGGPIAAIPAAAALLVLIIGLVLQFPLRRAAEKTQAESAYRHSLLVEAISALETIKTIRAEGTLQRVWERLVGSTARTHEKARRISSFIMNTTIATQQLVSVCIVIAGAYLFDQGEISMGAIIACVILGGRAVAPFGQFSSLIARSQQSITALKTLDGLMKMESERPDGKNFVSQPIVDGRIEFQNIEFSYPQAPNPALKDFNLTIQPGEKVGIIGKIGSGKTTVGRLLGGLYEAEGGTILIDGIDIRQYHPYQLRRAVGVVAQDSDLFFGTLRSNILMGAPDSTDDQMVKACQLAGVDDFANRHPSGFDMPVGERGSLLSGGQKQAVALARVLLLGPQVIFLDEPSGSMDLASERELIKHLREAFQDGQTIVLSTHRYSMLELVDRLVVIGNGKVVADGPKDKVMDALKAQSLKAKSAAS